MKLLVNLIKTLIFDQEIVEPKKKVDPKSTPKKTKPKVTQQKKTSVKKTTNRVSKKPKSKKDEIIEALDYMKTKKNKTKKDKESIYILEMVLKNMK